MVAYDSVVMHPPEVSVGSKLAAPHSLPHQLFEQRSIVWCFGVSKHADELPEVYTHACWEVGWGRGGDLRQGGHGPSCWQFCLRVQKAYGYGWVENGEASDAKQENYLLGLSAGVSRYREVPAATRVIKLIDCNIDNPLAGTTAR